MATYSLTKPRSYRVFNSSVDLMGNYSRWLAQRLLDSEGTHVVTLNTEMLMMGEKNPSLQTAIDEAELVIPDGAGIIIYLKLFGESHDRCPGIELAESLLHEIERNQSSKKVFFYGGKPGITTRAAQKFPRVDISPYHGYLQLEEQAELLQNLEKQQPDVIYVGLGVPRQELWIREHRHLCPHAIWIGVGGSFDVWAGAKPRAPRWMQKFT